MGIRKMIVQGIPINVVISRMCPRETIYFIPESVMAEVARRELEWQYEAMEDIEMPIKVKKQGSKYVVTDPKGKVYGKHATKEGASKQQAAINISKHKRGK